MSFALPSRWRSGHILADSQERIPVGLFWTNRLARRSSTDESSLEGLSGVQEGPKNALPDGTRYEYDPILNRTVEVTPSGERFPVTLVDGKLQRDSEKTDRRKGVLRRSPTPSGDTIPISGPKCVPESSKTGGTNEGER